MYAMIIGSVARQVLTGLGATLVTNGLVNDQQATQGIGALLALASLGWSLYQKYGHAQALATAASTGVVK
jgi:hypothetical protein